MSRQPSTGELQRAYLLWRDRSLSRWQALLGDDAGDLMSEVWLRLAKVASTYEHRSEQATLRYIETVAEFVMRDFRRAGARRQSLMATALELGARGLSVAGEAEPLVAPVDMEQVIASAGLTPRQRSVIAGMRLGVDREAIAQILEVSVETVKEYERAGIARIREAVRK